MAQGSSVGSVLALHFLSHSFDLCAAPLQRLLCCRTVLHSYFIVRE